MELTGAWEIPVGGKWPLGVKFHGDDLPTGVTVSSATKAVTPAVGLTVDDPVVDSDAKGVTFWVTAVTAGNYSVLVTVTRSDGGKNIALGSVAVVAASDRTTLAANALITVADFRGYVTDAVGVTKNAIETIINGISQEFDRFVGFVLKQATYTALYLDGNGEKYLPLPGYPAASLGTVTEDGTLLAEGLDDDYVLYTSDNDAYLQKISGVWLDGPKTELISTVKLGFATIPGDLILACLKQCAWEYQRMKRSEWGETSRSGEGGGSVSLVEPGLLPDVVAVLKRYRRAGL